MKRRIKAAGATDIGKRREKNDDAFCCKRELHIFAVADGMGQVPFGDVTAIKSCELMEGQAKKLYQAYKEQGNVKSAAERFRQKVEYMSNNIYQRGNGPDVFRYGSTYCGAMDLGSHVAIVNLGDSRAYAIYGRRTEADSRIQLLTEDHNMAWLAVSKGYMTPEDAKRNGLTARLTRFVGVSEDTQADVFIVPKKGIRDILLCSDGLHGMLSDQEIADIVLNHKAPDRVCRSLIAKANRKGGKDNITVVDIRLR